ARFSKMLATIRLDAPIDFSLPRSEWKDGVDTEQALALFSELGFRSLSARFRQLMGVEKEDLAGGDGSDVSAAEVLEAAALLWLLESDRANPSYEDIVDYGRSVFKTTKWSEIKEK